MIKTKLLMGLAALAVSLFASAAPASAWFEANSNTTSGPIKSFPEKSVFHASPGGPAVECKAKNSEGKVVAEGTWQIQVKQEQTKAGFQAQTKTGPHEQLKITKWGSCFGPISTIATVKCTLQVEQQEKSAAKPQTVTGSTYPPGCEVVIATCVIKVPAIEANRRLSEVKIENIGTNEVGIESEVKGITSQVNTACESTFGIKNSKEGDFKTEGGKLITEGQKLV
jgi:hypothetical protein